MPETPGDVDGPADPPHLLGRGLFKEGMAPGSALAHRVRRIYLPILSIGLLARLIRTSALSPTPLPSSAAIGAVPGWLVLGVVVALYLVAVVITVRPRTWKGHPELRSAEIGTWQEE